MSSRTRSRSELLDRRERSGSVLGLTDHSEPVRLEDHARAGAKARVVVDDEDPGARFHGRTVADTRQAGWCGKPHCLSLVRKRDSAGAESRARIPPSAGTPLKASASPPQLPRGRRRQFRAGAGAAWKVHPGDEMPLRPRQRAPSGICRAAGADSSPAGIHFCGFLLANKACALRGGMRSMPRVATSYSRA